MYPVPGPSLEDSPDPWQFPIPFVPTDSPRSRPSSPVTFVHSPGHLDILGEVFNLEVLNVEFFNTDQVVQDEMQEAIWNSMTGQGDEPPNNPGVVDGMWADLVGPCPPLPDSQVEDIFLVIAIVVVTKKENILVVVTKNYMIPLVKRGKKRVEI